MEIYYYAAMMLSTKLHFHKIKIQLFIETI